MRAIERQREIMNIMQRDGHVDCNVLAEEFHEDVELIVTDERVDKDVLAQYREKTRIEIAE